MDVETPNVGDVRRLKIGKTCNWFSYSIVCHHQLPNYSDGKSFRSRPRVFYPDSWFGKSDSAESIHHFVNPWTCSPWSGYACSGGRRPNSKFSAPDRSWKVRILWAVKRSANGRRFMITLWKSCDSNKIALRALPAVTRLTVHRRLQFLNYLGLNKSIFKNCLTVRIWWNFDCNPQKTFLDLALCTGHPFIDFKHVCGRHIYL